MASETAILEMILLQCPPCQILDTLCIKLGSERSERQVAFFLLQGEQWELAATGDLTEESAAILREVVPESLSISLFDQALSDSNTGAPGMLKTANGAFHARHLYSGMGELMGMFLCFESGGDWNMGRSEQLDDTCRLAVLAVEQRNLLEELKWQADHDALTGLPTRTCFERQLRQRMQFASAALLCINLDRFRLVNGVLGHSFGNVVLKNIGQRFQSCLPQEGILARVGGDEFAVLVSAEIAEATAERLHLSLTEPVSIDGHQLYKIGRASSRERV